MVQQLCPLSQTLVPFIDMAHPANLVTHKKCLNYSKNVHTIKVIYNDK